MKGGGGASAHELLSLMLPKISQYNYNAEDGKIIDTYSVHSICFGTWNEIEMKINIYILYEYHLYFKELCPIYFNETARKQTKNKLWHYLPNAI